MDDKKSDGGLADVLKKAVELAVEVDKKLREMPPEKTNGWFDTIRQSFLSKQVCSHLEGQALLDMVNMYEPSGTQNGWMFSEGKEHAPVQCDEHSNKKHYILIC